MILRLTALLVVLLLAFAGLELGWRTLAGRAPRGQVVTSVETSNRPQALNARQSSTPARTLGDGLEPAPAPARPASACEPDQAFEPAAAKNAASLDTAAWSAMGRAEQGWAVYATLARHELATACAPADSGFAHALAAWQGQHGLPASGVMDEPTLKALDVVWLRRRPFVAATAHGDCPSPPANFRLAFAAPSEGYMEKPVQLRTTALAAYRRLVAAARKEVPSAFVDERLLTIFSGYRDPAEEASRCAQGGCGTAAKANCSAHRTGLAMDLFLGAAPGYPPESSADANRLFQSRTEIYGWLVNNADRFDFVPYPFEPWHWEWTGEPL